VEAGRGDTFRSSTYDELRLTEDRLFYRDYSDPNRRFSAFWTRERSSGPFQSILDSAILPEWGNRATDTVTIRVPAGTTVYEGPTAPQGGLVGGGDQTVIPHVDPAWEVGP
jgi:filamentous hemagglutinin